MRIFLAEDAALIRAGLVEVLASAGHEITGTAADADALRTLIGVAGRDGTLPDLLVTDVRMPPDGTDDGLRAAIDLRREHPGLPVLVLSAYVSGPYVRRLLDDAGSGAGLGYLLKERVGRVADFLRTIDMVAGGGVVVDPEVVAHAMRSGRDGPLADLTPRESEVLRLMAEGLSNTQIADRLVLSAAAVSKHVANVFLKLDLPPGEDNRRVRAVLTWLRAAEKG
ncbi:LuxR C-terminal-related transcriptional regulator [Mobilicoccus massiliensis]|uniref:LuxR C-terminal-related transcriptional regulator n=1 Tax=Mobilicoccus massiliensis TaxID=1522310 RepID=UPI00058CF853|nr:response regulator transcription factor [Mobilicoccus massiliensis]